MARARARAGRAGPRETAPNPIVGAVLVRDGEVVGEGWHERAGGPHAEVVALEAAGERAAGATLYVTLEPCAHHGRTPPCAEALVEAGVARVVAAVGDPNPETTAPASSVSARPGSRSSSPAASSNGAPGSRTRPSASGWQKRRPFVVYKAASHAGRARHRPRLPLGDRGGEPPARARAARAGGRRRGRDGHRAGRRPAADGPGSRRRAPAAPACVRAAGRCPTARSSSFCTGPLEDELDGLADEGVQSLLLEGGPTLATAFLTAGSSTS